MRAPAPVQHVRAQGMPDRQQPNYTRVGAEDDAFENESPFTIG